MKIIPTRVFRDNLNAFKSGRRRALNEGGTGSSKTYSIMSLLIYLAITAPKKITISVVSESLPHLKRGCLRDFENILGSMYDPKRFNKSEFIYQFDNCTFEFFSADVSTKLRGGRRDILYINECNNITYDSYRELDIRTFLFTFLDWNPTSEFWIHQNNLQNEPENFYIHSTYLDVKKILPLMDEIDQVKIKSVIDNIESNKDKDPNWWNVYGLGKLGKITGLVHPCFEVVDELPPRNRCIELFGMDFGFANDPTALTQILFYGDAVYLHQLIYRTNMTNQDISEAMGNIGLQKRMDVIICDSAEPKSIEELYREGWNAKPATKGEGSVMTGIQKLNQLKIYVTKSSIDIIKELRNYRYTTDKYGDLTNKPIDMYNHAMDGVRYAVMHQLASMHGFGATVRI